MMRIMGIIVLVMMGLVAGCAWGVVESPKIDFSDPATYVADDKVYIEREAVTNEMLFKDDAISSPVRLSTLVNAGGVSDHGGLTGLGDDDHVSYYNADRLNTKLGTVSGGSGATYVISLPISGDVNGKTTIGGHVADSEVHYKRPGGYANVAKIGGQFSTIQDAINWLDTNYNGGIVDVAGGEYTEKITVPDNITIRGALGAVTIQNDVGPIITISNGCSAYLEGLTIKATNAIGNQRAISAGVETYLYAQNCVITMTSPDSDQSVLLYGMTLFRDCSFTGTENIMDINLNAEIIGCNFLQNTTNNNEVIRCGGASHTIRDTIIQTANYRGVFCDEGTTYLDNVRIKGSGDDIYIDTGIIVFTHGCAFDEIGGGGTLEELVEGWTNGKQFNVDKVAGEVDDAFRYRMDGVGRFWVDYEGNGYFAGNLQAANFSGGGSGIVTVAKEGGDYQTIQGAIDAVTTGVILIYPGIYAEQITLKDDVYLVGVERDSCIIKKQQDGASHEARAIIRMSCRCGIENLHVENTRPSGYSNVIYGSNGSDVKIRNCYIKSGEADAVMFEDTAIKVEISNCHFVGAYDVLDTYCDSEIRDTDVETYGAIASSHCWFHGSNHTITFTNCRFMGTANYGIIIAGSPDPGKPILYFRHCSWIGNSYDWPIYIYPTLTPVLYFENCSGSNFNTATSGGSPTWNFLIEGDKKIDNLTIQKDLDVWDDAVFRSQVDFWMEDPSESTLRWNATTGILEFFNGVDTFDVNLYRGGANELKTDDAFNCNSIKIAGTERISSAGVGTFSQCNTNTTQWRDIPAVCGNPFPGSGWSGSADSLSASAEDLIYFSIPYESGTVITRVRVKYSGGTVDDGVKLRIVKRLDSGTGTGWTVEGAQQTYKNNGVKVDTYDVADITMAESYSYAIEVAAIVATVSANLYSVGIETSKRVY